MGLGNSHLSTGRTRPSFPRPWSRSYPRTTIGGGTTPARQIDGVDMQAGRVTVFGDCMASGVFGGMGYPGYLSMAYISSHVRCAVYETKNSCITQAEKLLCKFVYSAIMALGL